MTMTTGSKTWNDEKPVRAREKDNSSLSIDQHQSRSQNDFDVDEKYYQAAVVFWKKMETYFAPLTKQDVDFCSEEQLTNLNESPYFEIPKLGENYMCVWEEEGYYEDKRYNNGRQYFTDVEPKYMDITSRIITSLVDEHLIPTGFANRWKKYRNGELSVNETSDNGSNIESIETKDDQNDPLCKELKLLQEELTQIVDDNNGKKRKYYPLLLACYERQQEEQAKLREMFLQEQEYIPKMKKIRKRKNEGDELPANKKLKIV
eukprot:TRINITY_DN9102_c0_g1_i2.p1 TRINITY_DN9102_c0_g1~~TRINITY_DN9102_c0_g1_i2.p1  ORF type:complete len:284 (-),score=77.89 TRINITY_DN9102_c0_g1_i2:21-803(-)